MPNPPNADLLRSCPKTSLEENLKTLRTLLNIPVNEDVVVRRCRLNGFDIAVVYVEGMANDQKISEFVLHACKFTFETEPFAAGGRIARLGRETVEIAQCSVSSDFRKIVSGVLGGMTAVIADGDDEILLMETRGFAHRPVGKPLNESVVMGPHEGFVENIRTNITLIRRYLQSSELITERLTVGTGVPTGVALIYLKGIADPKALAEVRRRLKTISAPTVQGTGGIQQLIEDSPGSIFPQMLQTERPDRAAACLTEGQFVILTENSPYALTAPVTLYHLLHASDDSFMRWQYASFLRLIRIIGLLLSLLLPGLYVALTLHHTHIIPYTLLLSIARTRTGVPFSVITEVLIMEFAFFLINEAGTRIPSQIGSTISIVGALILGQAAVSASVISPVLIIVIALTGLGNFASPSYSLGLSVVIYRILLVAAGGIMGLYGLLPVLVALTVHLCGVRSFGVPYLAPVAPRRPHNPDILLRLPLRFQKKPMYYAAGDDWLHAGEENRS